jgi:regulator of protease activity HflC (stomatin/prohibitin superfamily)
MTTLHIFILLCVLVGAAVVANIVFARYRHEFLVNDGFSGLLYHEGKLLETLTAGRYLRWGHNYRLVIVDTRNTLLQVAGQEVLSADNVGVKVSLVLTMQVVDAVKSVQAADVYASHIYSAAQTAVRSVVASVTMDALLTQRIAIGAQLRDLIAAQAEAVGVQIHTADVRDVMLPGELRKAFNEVLKAKQDAQVALERARSEPPHSATSPMRRVSLRTIRRSPHCASCKRSRHPMQAVLW